MNIKACLAFVITIVLFTSTEANQLSNGLPIFTEKRPFECFERVKVTRGGTTELRCDVDGNPKPNITWTRFGEIVGDTHNMNITGWSMVLKDITREECGLYECNVCNEHGCVTFEYLVEMDDHGKDVVTVGAWHQLVCYGIDSKNVTWTKNTHSWSCFTSITDKHNWEVSDQNENDNLIFERITYADAGLYICTNGSEHYLRELIVLSNKFEDESHKDHSFVRISSRSSVTLECAWNDANISWTKNNEALLDNTNSRIVLNDIAREDSGLYRCEVCYRAECRAHQFLLIVDTIFTDDSMVRDAIWPYCRSILSDFNVEYSIDYVEQRINESHLQENKDKQSMCTKAGWCTCVVTSVYGKHFKSVYLQSPRANTANFTSNVQADKVFERREGESLNVSCDTNTEPKPNIIWTRDGKRLQQNARVASSLYWMHIKNLTPDDNGRYTCKICNTVGCSKRSYGILVRRQNEGNITNITTTVNSTANLTCLDQYYSFVQEIVWNFKGDIISPSPNKLQYIRHLNVLRFPNIQLPDAGTYLCKVLFHSGEILNMTFNVSVVVPLKIARIHPETISIITILIGISACSCTILLVLPMICKKPINSKPSSRQHEATASNQSLDNDYETIDISVLASSTIKQQRHSISSRISTSFDPDYDIPTDIRWEFPRDKLELGSILAQGTFGKVVQAEARGIVPGSSNTTTVAVKMLKLRHTDDDVEDFIRELDIMKMIGKHPNIINLLGCCSTNGPLYIITEYAPHGNLKHFLQEHRPGEINTSSGTINDSCSLSVNQLTDFACQIAKGMDYLASRKCVHRDLAARNILVSDDYVMKIADFGLARDVHAEELYHKVTTGKLPIRWMAPESLEYRLFSTQSDVWSYGVLIWEIMTLGEQPYKDWDNIHNQLVEGRRMEQPELCPDEVNQLMTRCWQFQPEMRPTFSEIAQGLKKLVVQPFDDEYDEVHYTPEMESK